MAASRERGGGVMARTRRPYSRITVTREFVEMCKRLGTEHPDKTIRELSVMAGCGEQTCRNAINGAYDERFEPVPAPTPTPVGEVPLPMIVGGCDAGDGDSCRLAPYELELRTIARVCAASARALVAAWFSQDELGDELLAEIDDAMSWMDGGDAQ